jgi:hypothetical protein
MTGAQASYLKTLSEEAGDPDTFDENLAKAEASGTHRRPQKAA